jgi:hypothetical protein
LDNAIKEDRYDQIRETSIDAITGSASTNLLYSLAQEKVILLCSLSHFLSFDTMLIILV